MEIKYFKPQSEILQKYIEGFYYLTNGENNSQNSYLTFPNNNCIVSIVKNCNLVFQNEKVLIQECQNQMTSSVIISNYINPILISYSGKIEELTICFKPLGINNFLDNKLSFYLNSFFMDFEPYSDFIPAMKLAIDTKDLEKSCDELELYWLSKLTPFDSSFMYKAIQFLDDFDNEHTIKHVADMCFTTRQNLFKTFETHLGKSPSEYKKINRFRHALNQYKKHKETMCLSDLLAGSTFYDQSHMSKDFKSLTGQTPRKFLKNINCDYEKPLLFIWL